MVSRKPQVGEVWTHTGGTAYEVIVAEPDLHGRRIMRGPNGTYQVGMDDRFLDQYTPPRPPEPKPFYVVIDDNGRPALTIYNEKAARSHADETSRPIAVMKFSHWLD